MQFLGEEQRDFIPVGAPAKTWRRLTAKLRWTVSAYNLVQKCRSVSQIVVENGEAEGLGLQFGPKMSECLTKWSKDGEADGLGQQFGPKMSECLIKCGQETMRLTPRLVEDVRG